MGRRSDHSREQLREIIIAEGHRQIGEVGFAQFSAREVAKRIGYSIGTLYNVFGSYDQLMLAINGRTLDVWLAHLQAGLDQTTNGDRLAAAVRAYFDFAANHTHAWAALYDFRLPIGQAPPADYAERVARVLALVESEVRSALPEARKHKASQLAPSLLALVHGHCFFAMNRTFAVLGTEDPLEAALARVREAIAAG